MAGFSHVAAPNVGESQVVLVNKDAIFTALADLIDAKSETDWVILQYGKGHNDLEYKEKGTGGLDEFKKHLKDDIVQFGIVQVTIRGDDYNPIKNVLVTWIGPKVPPGLKKARASGHRGGLVAELEVKVAIAAQFTTDKMEEMNADNIAQAITRIRAVYGSASQADKPKAMARSDVKAGGKVSKLTIIEKEKVEAGLRSVHEAKNDWAILSYVEGKNDEVELIASGGNGLEGLKQYYPTNRIYFCVVRLAGDEAIEAFKTQKFVLLTLVGPEVKPLQKARSAGQRQEVSDFVLSVIPFQGHYQPIDKDDVNRQSILGKFK